MLSSSSDVIAMSFHVVCLKDSFFFGCLVCSHVEIIDVVDIVARLAWFAVFVMPHNLPFPV